MPTLSSFQGTSYCRSIIILQKQVNFQWSCFSAKAVFRNSCCRLRAPYGHVCRRAGSSIVHLLPELVLCLMSQVKNCLATKPSTKLLYSAEHPWVLLNAGAKHWSCLWINYVKMSLSRVNILVGVEGLILTPQLGRPEPYNIMLFGNAQILLTIILQGRSSQIQRRVPVLW